jgi:tetratricopeptide (TPR) repeat protein
MLARGRRNLIAGFAILLLGLAPLSSVTLAQSEDSFGDAGADPVKLFERGQSAHAKGEFEKALALYEAAIKVRPEFPEAEFQRGNVLVSLGRFNEAQAALERAIELKKDWSLPYSTLGALFVRQGKDHEAEPLFRQALKLDSHNSIALRMLAEVRLKAGDKNEAISLARDATRDTDAPMSAWLVLALAQKASGDRVAAKSSLDHVLETEPENLAGLLERADLFIDDGDFGQAILDLKTAERIKPEDKHVLSRLAFAYDRAGNAVEARRAARAAGIELKQESEDGIKVVGTPEEIAAANSDDPETSRPALQKLLDKNPRNAMLLARLASFYRTTDPARALALYRQASEIQPNNPQYATGYAATLIQTRRFGEAVGILQRVLAADPKNYAAHANLATALYELKRYPEALPEYEWLLQTKPDLAVAHYFIATIHDYLGEYVEALPAYETFIERADPQTNQLEIDKVKLRLPLLRRQIQLGQGVKRKTQ